MDYLEKALELSHNRNITPTFLMFKLKISKEYAEELAFAVWQKQKETAKKLYEEYIETLCN